MRSDLFLISFIRVLGNFNATICYCSGSWIYVNTSDSVTIFYGETTSNICKLIIMYLAT